MPSAPGKDEEIDGKGIEEFIAQKDSGRGTGLLEGGADAESRNGRGLELPLESLAQGGTWLDETVFERVREGAADFAEGGEDVPGETAVVPALLDDDQGLLSLEISLPGHQKAMREEPSKGIADRDTGIKIPLPAHFAEPRIVVAAGIVAPFGVVEGQIHPCRKGHRTFRTF
jgi:hypothetical protein